MCSAILREFPALSKFQANWGKLPHTYGAVIDIPELLRELTDKDKNILSYRLYQLYSTIWHQGMVYGMIAYAANLLDASIKAAVSY